MKMAAKKTATAKKSAAAKPAKKAAAAKPAKTISEDQAVVFKLLQRENGCTLTDIKNAGYAWPAMSVLKMAERNGMKTSSKKVAGELTRYFARRQS
jgi:CO dehydrogenase/acetyl-CoA synthase alpha subunit